MIKENSGVSALFQLAPLTQHYLPWSSSSMRPQAIVRIVNEIILNQRRNLIEFGAGISTIFIASALRELDAEFPLCSVEHSDKWIEIVQSLLKKENLDQHVSFIHAPMEKSSLSMANLDWYSEQVLSTATKGYRFSMAIIDGPFAHTKELQMSRYPALPFLIKNDLLAESNLILLDDSHRKGEKAILRLWESEFGRRFTLPKSLGAAISTVGESFNT